MWYGLLIFCGVVGGILLADTGHQDKSGKMIKTDLKDKKTKCDRLMS